MALTSLMLLICGPVFGNTFFIFVEESLNGEYGEAVSPVSEGLLAGLFDKGHIVFDDNGLDPGFPWEAMDFTRLLKAGREGGAEYFVAVRVLTFSHKVDSSEAESRKARYDSTVSYTCWRVAGSRLLGSGEMAGTTDGGEQTLSRASMGLDLGERLSVAVVAVCLGEDDPEPASGDRPR